MDLKREQSVLVLVDFQEKLAKVIHDHEKLSAKCATLLNGIRELSVDMIIAEQYPKGLGHTESLLLDAAAKNTPVIEKTTFSCFGEAEFRKALKSKRRKNLIVCGIESHVCVLQTVLDALAGNYNCFVVADAVGSREAAQIGLALDTMRQAGAVVLSIESILFMLTKDTKDPAFKAISKLVI